MTDRYITNSHLIIHSLRNTWSLLNQNQPNQKDQGGWVGRFDRRGRLDLDVTSDEEILEEGLVGKMKEKDPYGIALQTMWLGRKEIIQNINHKYKDTQRNLFIRNKKFNWKNQIYWKKRLRKKNPDQSIWDINNFGIDKTWEIPHKPYKVLDAPNISDDYYWDLLTWGNSNILAVGLADNWYLWHADTSEVEKLDWEEEDKSTNKEESKVTSLSWSIDGKDLAVGKSGGIIEIWDVNWQKIKRKFNDNIKDKRDRISWLSWWSHSLAAGGKDNKTFIHDFRDPRNEYSKLENHKLEVWGLKWSPSEDQLATGGNDNMVTIWNSFSYDHPAFELKGSIAAVKAIVWSPLKHGILITGSGRDDGQIRFWNSITGKMIKSVDTFSQVWQLAYSERTNSIISTHGFWGVDKDWGNRIIIWDSQSMKSKATLKYHNDRVLFLTLNPEQDTIVTGSKDETIRFWRIAESKSNKHLDFTPKLNCEPGKITKVCPELKLR